MIDNPVEKPSDEVLAKKEVVVNTFAESATELGVTDKVDFEGFYFEDSNVRAKESGRSVSFNEKYLGIDAEELKRWSYHEIQHVINVSRQYAIWVDPNGGLEKSKLIFAFVLHPDFKDLYSRILTSYNEGKKNQYPYAKVVKNLPKDYSQIDIGAEDYADPGEVLALLRGYQCYLKQLSEGKQPKTVHAEFTEAFKPEDLRFLDEGYRELLWKELEPTISKSTHVEITRTTKEDLE